MVGRWSIAMAPIVLAILITNAASADDASDFRNQFDAARRELLDDRTLWLATPEAAKEEERAADHLQTLVAGSQNAANLPAKMAGPRFVLFVIAGTTENEPWLAFGRYSLHGLELVAVHRRGREFADYSRLFEMRTLLNRKPLRVELVANRRLGADVETILRIEGSENRIVWKFGKSRNPMEQLRHPGITIYGGSKATVTTVPGFMTELRNIVGSRWTGIEAVPQIGWVQRHKKSETPDFDNYAEWWPETDGMRMLESDVAPQEFEVHRPAAITFLHDRDLVAASDKNVYRIELQAGSISEKAWSTADGHPSLGTFVFSPKGSRLFAAPLTSTGYFVDVESAEMRRRTEPVLGKPRAHFLDEDSLLLQDNKQFVKVDWRTLDWTPVPTVDRLNFRWAKAGRFFACISRNQMLEVHLSDFDTGELLKKFASIQGLHQLSISPDGTRLVLKGQSGLRMYHLADGSLLWDHDHDGDMHASLSVVKWTPDGKYGVTGGNQFVYVWRIDQKWVMRILHGRKGGHPDVAISDDGRRLAVSTRESKIAYWPDLKAPPPKAATPTVR
jgi:hypothetical protein